MNEAFGASHTCTEEQILAPGCVVEAQLIAELTSVRGKGR